VLLRHNFELESREAGFLEFGQIVQNVEPTTNLETTCQNDLRCFPGEARQFSFISQVFPLRTLSGIVLHIVAQPEYPQEHSGRKTQVTFDRDRNQRRRKPFSGDYIKVMFSFITTARRGNSTGDTDRESFIDPELLLRIHQFQLLHQVTNREILELLHTDGMRNSQVATSQVDDNPIFGSERISDFIENRLENLGHQHHGHGVTEEVRQVDYINRIGFLGKTIFFK
jgi:hypothetical protein